VAFEYRRKVINVAFLEQDDGRRGEALHCARDERSFTCSLGWDDHPFITIGSMTADSRNGDDAPAPELVGDKCDGARNEPQAAPRAAGPDSSNREAG
jgi:oleate hydratase